MLIIQNPKVEWIIVWFIISILYSLSNQSSGLADLEAVWSEVFSVYLKLVRYEYSVELGSESSTAADSVLFQLLWDLWGLLSHFSSEVQISVVSWHDGVTNTTHLTTVNISWTFLIWCERGKEWGVLAVRNKKIIE